ncbi:unnamed protein product, partial [Adineta steineri]
HQPQCFIFEQISEQCTTNYCHNNGHCVKNTFDGVWDFDCVCGGCAYGSLCQLTTSQYALSLDPMLGLDILANISLTNQPFLIKLTLIIIILILLVGLLSNGLSLITFMQPKVQEIGCGLYLFCLPIISQLGLFVLAGRFFYFLCTQLYNVDKNSHVLWSCITLEYFLNIFPMLFDWLTACVAVERSINMIKGIGFKKSESVWWAKRVILCLIIIVLIGSWHEPFIHELIDDPRATTRHTCYRLYQHLYLSKDINPNGKYVLITGCDTGFGHTLAIELDKQGFNVFAGIYNQENQISFQNKLSSRAIVFHLDITQSSHIDAAYKLVKEKTNTLHALVNNAGIDQDCLIDWITLDFMRKMMEVNFFGHVSMTKTFLPLLITKQDSRVVNLCSVAGYMVAPTMSSYCASKFAFEAFSDCLRREMHAWKLHVSIIEPGYMRTPIVEGHVETMKKLWNELPVDTKDRWGEDYLNNIVNKRSNNLFIYLAENPMKVVRALQHAVTNTHPNIRYRPGWQSSLIFFPLSMLPAWFADFILYYGLGANVTPAGVYKQAKE